MECFHTKVTLYHMFKCETTYHFALIGHVVLEKEIFENGGQNRSEDVCNITIKSPAL